MTVISTPLTFGVGSLRFNPETTSPEEVRALGKALLEHPSIGPHLRGPVKYYHRGQTDVRLEYDYEIPRDEAVSDKFYQDVRALAQRTVRISGKWHHSHTTGVERIGTPTLPPQVQLVFEYGASLIATGFIPGESGHAYQYATIVTSGGRNVKIHLFKEYIAALSDAISEGMRESATTGRVSEKKLPFGLSI